MFGRIRSLLQARAAGPPPSAPSNASTLAGIYNNLATEADILHCFRLLLGRHPQREEWRGHSMRVGEKLDGIVAGYLNSAEFAHRGLLQHGLAQALEIADLPLFRIYVSPDDLDVGRHVRVDGYEPEVTAVFHRLLKPGMSVLDIGANIGYFTMLSAAIVGTEGHVFAVEPNPRNLRMLEASRRLNGFDHVVPVQVAAGRNTGLLVLNAAHSNGTTMAPRAGNDSAGLDALLAAETVPSLRLDDIIAPGRQVDLVKIDVEGAEYNALLGCVEMLARDRPSIISEFSPGQMPGISGISGPDYLRWLVTQGYSFAVVEPDGSTERPGTDPDPVMAVYEARATDHIDILATPV